jgi:hypothetical protein
MRVRLFYGNGNGAFGPAVEYQVGQRPVSWGAPLDKGTHIISFIYSGNSTFSPHTAKITVTVH